MDRRAQIATARRNYEEAKQEGRDEAIEALGTCLGLVIYLFFRLVGIVGFTAAAGELVSVVSTWNHEPVGFWIAWASVSAAALVFSLARLIFK